MYTKIEQKWQEKGYSNILKLKADLSMMIKAFIDNSRGPEKYRVAMNSLLNEGLETCNFILNDEN